MRPQLDFSKALDSNPFEQKRHHSFIFHQRKLKSHRFHQCMHCYPKTIIITVIIIPAHTHTHISTKTNFLQFSMLNIRYNISNSNTHQTQTFNQKLFPSLFYTNLLSTCTKNSYKVMYLYEINAILQYYTFMIFYSMYLFNICCLYALN